MALRYPRTTEALKERVIRMRAALAELGRDPLSADALRTLRRRFNACAETFVRLQRPAAARIGWEGAESVSELLFRTTPITDQDTAALKAAVDRIDEAIPRHSDSGDDAVVIWLVSRIGPGGEILKKLAPDRPENTLIALVDADDAEKLVPPAELGAVLLVVGGDASVDPLQAGRIAYRARRSGWPVLSVATEMTLDERLALHALRIDRIVPPDAPWPVLHDSIENAIYDQEPGRGAVWLIEDDPQMANLLTSELDLDDFRVRVIPRLEKLEWAAAEPLPDAVALAESTLGGRPAPVCRVLRRDPRFRRTALLVYGTDLDPGSAEFLLDSGVDEVVWETDDAVDIARRLRRLAADRAFEGGKMGENQMMTMRDLMAGPPGPEEKAEQSKGTTVVAPPPISGEFARLRAGPARVLMADDDALVRRIVAHHLRKEGYIVEEAGDGEACEKLLDRTEYDLLLLDLHMPFRSGFDVMKRLRDRPIATPMKIVVLSANAQDSTVVRAFQLGADEVLSKPFSPPALMSRIQRVMRA